MMCSPLSPLIAVPLAGAVLALAVPRRMSAYMASIGAFANALLIAYMVKAPQSFSCPWAGTTWALKLDLTAAVMLSAASVTSLLVILFAADRLKDTAYARAWHALMLTAVALANGALLSDNLTHMLFFWEALLIPLFGMIVIAHPEAHKTAVKSFVIVGIADLCLMFGMGLLEHVSHQHTVSGVHIAVGAEALIAFICMFIGALAKSGAVPFHSWVPDAAEETPLPFTLAIPASLGRILGVYLVIRMLTYQFFFTSPWVSRIVIIAGAATLLWGALRAAAQPSTRKMTAYASIAITGLCLVVTGAFFSESPAAAAMFTAVVTILSTAAFMVCGARETACDTALARLTPRTGIFKTINQAADNTRFDPYAISMKIVHIFAVIAFGLDRAINWIYDGFVPFAASVLSTIVRLFHTGNYASYVVWSLAGTVVIIAVLLR